MDGEELLVNGGPTEGAAAIVADGAAACAPPFDEGRDEGCPDTLIDMTVWATADDTHNDSESGRTWYKCMVTDLGGTIEGDKLMSIRDSDLRRLKRQDYQNLAKKWMKKQLQGG